jgi:excisionase family DNA binding protein
MPHYATTQAADMSQHANDRAADMSDSNSPPIRATIEEAARLLGVTGNAVRKRIERGTLRSEKANGTRYVLLDDGMPDMSRRVTDETSGMPHDITSLGHGIPAAFVDSLQDQIEYLREQLDKEREANRENRRLLAAALERIPELEASSEPRESPETATEEPYRTHHHAPPGPDHPVERPSWWRKFFGLE